MSISKKRKQLSSSIETRPARTQKASLKGDVPPLGKFLASNDKLTRDRAVKALRKFLSGQSQEEDSFQEQLFATGGEEELLSHQNWEPIKPENVRLNSVELAKLYKGLFYCYWMSDKPIVQQDLAQELSDLSLNIRPISTSTSSDRILDQISTTQTALSFWKQFWIKLSSEWQGVDKHRLDKYLLLMRRFLSVSFEILLRVNWHAQAIELWSEILKDTILNVADFKTPLSITYHITDIFLSELNRVLQNKGDHKPAPILKLLNPFMHGLSNSRPGTVTFQKIIDNIFDPLFANLDLFISDRTQVPKSSTIEIYTSFETHLISSDNSKNLTSIRNEILDLLFKAGSDPTCTPSNRKKIYNYWFSKRGIDDEQEQEEDN
ncbi:hypothetical protein MJO28_001200 [Puccinia striiformis f. sp. tritici]|uniref:Uncharacterized protein n=1 Tax=Puccinia striiformis f. sp. tritici TaxID=168172 RepID=A0ACC0F0K2_9BASI|nr:hypothetical protein MJO28_001200 [Puccinia striiformis f. sp. tritici]